MRITMTSLAKVVAAGVVIVAAAGGCSAQTGGTAAPAATTQGQATMVVPGTTTSAASAPKARSGLPSAADGSNFEACANGNCEVQVDGPTTIPVPGMPLIGGKVQIQQISSAAVTAAASVFGFPASSTAPSGGTMFLNGLTIKVVAVQGSSAVLRLST